MRSTEAGELSLLPRNHNLETDTAEPEKGDSSKKVPYDGSGKGFLKVHAHGRRTPKEVAEQIELRRRVSIFFINYVMKINHFCFSLFTLTLS